MADQPTEEQIRRFARLFDGYSKVYGRYEVTKPTKKGSKKDGKAFTVHKPLGKEQYRQHLAGDGPGLGVVPLRDDDTVLFAAIDVDDYEMSVEGVEEQIRKRELPFVVCRSKSGGAHLYLFLSEPAEAEEVRDRVSAMALSLGFGGCEVFPKQSYRAGPQDVGNWINVPYFRGKRGLRYAIHEGKALTLDEFLDHAESRFVRPEDIEKIGLPSEELKEEDKEYLEGAPPCLCHFAAIGSIPEGQRNASMFNMAVYLKKRFPDDWEDKIQTYNVRYCNPPLSMRELQTLVKSVNKKEYDLNCRGPYCDRRACSKARYGAGLTEGRSCEIGSIVKHDGDPVYWTVEIEGIRVTNITTDQLYSQSQFNKLCMEKISRVPGQMPTARWQRYLDERLQSADVIPAPVDASRKGQFYELLGQFITATSRRARHRDEILQDKPYHDTETKEVMFRSTALFEYLQDKRFKYRSEHEVWQWLREIGASKQVLRLKSTTIRVWIIPEPEMPDFEDDSETETEQEVF